MVKFFWAIVTLMSVFRADAEYRVYQYFIKSTYPKTDDQKSYVVTSTLDPVSYLAYNGGGETIKVDLVRSWVCLGHTGDKVDYCLPPESTSNEVARIPAETKKETPN